MFSEIKWSIKLGLFIVLVLQTEAAMGQQDRMQQIAQPQSIPLKVVDKKMFCDRLKNRFEVYGRQNGYSQVQVAMLSNSATAGLIEEFRAGRATDFISTKAIAAFSRVPEKGQQGYLPVSNFVSGAMGLGSDITLALAVGELRFIPFAQKNKDLVVVARSTMALSPARAQKVAGIARDGKIRVNVIWMGRTDLEEDEDKMSEARQLAWLAAVTGGSFVNLSGTKNPCGFVM
jgi:hypothetical protein